MRGTGQQRSKERSGSYTRKSPAASKLPANYRPPHMQNNFVGGNQNRVSPGAPRLGA